MIKQRYLAAFVLLFIAGSMQAQPLLTLQMAVDSLLANNYFIRIARNNVTIAGNNNNPGNAGMLPTVAVTATQSNAINDTRQEFFTGEVRQADNARNTSMNASARLDWTLFDGFTMFATRDKLAVLEKIADNSTAITIEEQLYQVSSIYYELIARHKMVIAYEEALRVSNERKGLAQMKARIGTASQVELLQSITDLNADSAFYLMELNTVKNLKNDLLLAMAVSTPFDFAIDTAIVYAEDLVLQEVETKAMTQNLNVLQSKLFMANAYAEQRQVKGLLFPQLGVFGEYTFVKSQSQVGILKSNQTLGPGFGVSLRYNIFNGFTVKNQVNNAKLTLENTAYQLENNKLQVKAEVTRAYNDYLLNRQLLALEQSNYQSARDNQEIAREQYRIGVINDLQYRLVQQARIAAEGRLINAQYTIKLAEMYLFRLKGEFVQSTVRQ